MRAISAAINLILVLNATPIWAVELGTGFTIDEDALNQLQQRPATGPVTLSPQSPATPANPAAESRCIPSRPYKESTPFKIYVDQKTQTATVTSPDFPPGQTLTFKVSTGGSSALTTSEDGQTTSAKIPDPKSGVQPYCPSTGAITEPKLITAFQQEEFAGRRDCTEDEIRGRSTAFPGNSYKSTQFNALMPDAIRFRGGQFFHKCPTGEACELLGQPLSGECVRVPGETVLPEWMAQAIKENRIDTSALAVKSRVVEGRDGREVRVKRIAISETLMKQFLKYGAIEVTMSEPPPMRERGESARKYPYPTRMHCDQQDIQIAKMIQKSGVAPAGGWEPTNFGKAIGDFFSGIFGGGKDSRPQSPSSPARQETAEERAARKKREREEARRKQKWQDDFWKLNKGF